MNLDFRIFQLHKSRKTMAKIYFVIRIETDGYLVSSIFSIHFHPFSHGNLPAVRAITLFQPIRSRVTELVSLVQRVPTLIILSRFPLRFPFVNWKQLRSTGNDRFENRSRSFTIDLKSRWKFRNLESWYRFEREVKQDTASVTGWFSLWKLYIYIYLFILVY